MKAAVGGAGVANDVGNSFSQRQSQGRLLLRAEGLAVRLAFSQERDTGGIKGTTRGIDFCFEAARAVAADGLPDLSKRGAGRLLDVCHFRDGAVGIERDETAGKFGLEDDNGECMAENIMQVTRNAFALSDGGEGDVLFKSGAELGVGTFLLGEIDVATADDDNEEYGNEGVRPADVKRAVLFVDGEEGSFGKNDYTLK